MKRIILAALLLFVVSMANAQQSADKKLVADETWLATSGKSGFRLITSNATVYKLITTKLMDSVYKISSTQKKDRKGQYWESSFYFKNTYYPKVLLFIKTL